VLSKITVKTPGSGLWEITSELTNVLSSAGVLEGLCTVFIQHTSASLIIQENADPSAKADLEAWLSRLVPENDPEFTHTFEGTDDMPAHIKAALTNVSLSIPIDNGCLALGTWQGVYLWEHRHRAHRRNLLVHIA